MASRLRLISMCTAALLATGCAQLIAPPYSSDYEALDRLKRVPAERVAVATVQPTDANNAVNNLSLRGAGFRSGSGTFAKYLEDALVGDLKEISLYDATARTRIDTVIQKNEIAVANISTGTGLMDVELTVARDGKQRLRKVYSAQTSFESSFAGAVAIPKGQAEYPNLVRALLREVYTDPAFIAAISK
ncbi:hypothetical protein LJR290_004910 [Variovorax sp. LjRoot290]|uniref:hypothetical protein n=1 Tax=Variovorax sp. LjRoot290 TaxID=3342316 RepID=UPI003ECEC690